MQSDAGLTPLACGGSDMKKAPGGGACLTFWLGVCA
jgi:hypothetical protein